MGQTDTPNLRYPLDSKQLLTKSFDLICNLLVTDSIHFKWIVNYLISAQILTANHQKKAVEDPNELLNLLREKAPDQIERFFVALLGYPDKTESYKNTAKEFSLKLIELIQPNSVRNGSSIRSINTIHVHCKEFGDCVVHCLKTIEPNPNLINYSELMYTSEDTLSSTPNRLSLISNTTIQQFPSGVEFQQNTLLIQSNEDNTCHSQNQSVPKATTIRDTISGLIKRNILKILISVCIFCLIVLVIMLCIYCFGQGPIHQQPVPPHHLLILINNPIFSNPIQPPMEPAQSFETRVRPPEALTNLKDPLITRKNEPIRNYYKVLHPPEATIISLTDQQLLQTIQSNQLCSTVDSRILAITFSNTSKHLNLNVSCEPKVTGLQISGSISSSNFKSLFQAFSTIIYLNLSGHDLCNSLQMNPIESTSNQANRIILKSLRFIHLINLPACPALYHFLEFIEIPAVTTVVLEDVWVSSGNTHQVQRFLGKPKAIKHLYFRAGSICPECLFFTRPKEGIDPWRTLEILWFHVPHELGHQGLLNLKRLILPSLPLLEYFDSSVEIPSRRSLEMIKRLSSLRFMNIAIKFPRSQTQFSASFFASFPFLRQAFVTLKFNETSACRQNKKVSISLTNLKRNVAYSALETLVMTSNCDINPLRGWSIPCFEFQVTNDPPTRMQTVNMSRCPNCCKSGLR